MPSLKSGLDGFEHDAVAGAVMVTMGLTESNGTYHRYWWWG